MSNKKQILITLDLDTGLEIQYEGKISKLEIIGIAELLKNNAMTTILKTEKPDTSTHTMD
jgi:hypothetical protein